MDVPGKTARIIRIFETRLRKLSEFFRPRRNFAVKRFRLQKSGNSLREGQAAEAAGRAPA
jgi:hypothetical protein